MKLTFLLTSLLTAVSISLGQSLLEFSSNGKYGYINSKGETKIEPSFSSAQKFSEGFAFVSQGEKYGIINESGNMIVDYTFDHAFPFQDGVAIVAIDSLYGLIDIEGNFIIRPSFERLYFQGEGIIGARKDNRWGFYSTTKGHAITDIKYARIGIFKEGLAMVQDNLSRKYGFIDKEGQVVIPFSLTQVYSAFNDGFAAVSDSNRHNCYIDKTGKNIFNNYYYIVNRFSEGFAFVKEDNEFGYFINKNGDRISKDNFQNTWWFNEGFCGVKTDSSFAVIDRKHQIVFESKNTELRFFSNGFGFFCNHSENHITWGLMDTNMNIVSELDFVKIFSTPSEDCVEFYLGDAKKWYGYSKRGYIDINGNIIWKEE